MTMAEVLQALASARGKLASGWASAQAADPNDPRGWLTHQNWTRTALNNMRDVGINPLISAGVIEGMGQANENVSGLVNAAFGSPFYSATGYDVTDIDANRRGLMQGLQNLDLNTIFQGFPAPINPTGGLNSVLFQKLMQALRGL